MLVAAPVTPVAGGVVVGLIDEAAGIVPMPLVGVCAIPLEPTGEAAGIVLIPFIPLTGVELPAMDEFPGIAVLGIPPMLVVGVGLDPIGAAVDIPPMDVVGIALGVFAIAGALVDAGIPGAAPVGAPAIPVFELPVEGCCDIALAKADTAPAAMPGAEGAVDCGALSIALITVSETPACFKVIKAFGEVSNLVALF